MNETQSHYLLVLVYAAKKPRGIVCLPQSRKGLGPYCLLPSVNAPNILVWHPIQFLSALLIEAQAALFQPHFHDLFWSWSEGMGRGGKVLVSLSWPPKRKYAIHMQNIHQ